MLASFLKSFRANREVISLGFMWGVCLEAVLDYFRAMSGWYWAVFGV